MIIVAVDVVVRHLIIKITLKEYWPVPSFHWIKHDRRRFVFLAIVIGDASIDKSGREES